MGNAEGFCGLDPAELFAPVHAEKTIGLAVSGGADSLALMLLYAGWADPAKPPAIVYTLDHRLRPEAHEEAEMVMALATKLGLATRLLRWDGDKPATGLQAAARGARYRLIGEAMQRDGARVLLTAHHRGDQAETVLMRLAHGSGVGGLGGMRAFSNVEGVRVFRPLLSVRSETLMTIIGRAGLMPSQDPSNTDTDYERVRWRAALPHLAGLGLTQERLAAAARRFQRIDAFAERLTDEFIDQHGQIDGLGLIALPRQPLLDADAEIGVRVLGRAIGRASGRPLRALGKIEALYARMSADETFTLTLGGAVVAVSDERAVFFREAGRIKVDGVKLDLGQTVFWDNRFRIEALSEPLAIARGADLTRAVAEKVVGHCLDVPVAALKAAPVVRNGQGEILAIGAHVIGKGARIEQPKLTARP